MPTALFIDRLKTLLREHFNADSSLTWAHWFGPKNEEGEVHLIEVNPDGPDMQDIYVISFKSSPEVPFRLQIAEVHPDEWEAMKRGELELPEHWEKKPIKSYSRDDLFGELNVPT